MRVQHKDIPNDQLHEVKGAVDAMEGTFLKGVGDGTTKFEKVKLSDLGNTLGAVQPGTGLSVGPDQTVVGTTYPYLQFTQLGSTVTADRNSGHFMEDTFSFTASVSGVYSVSVDPSPEGGFPSLFNVDTMVDLSQGHNTWLVAISAGARYRLGGTGSCSLFKVAP